MFREILFLCPLLDVYCSDVKPTTLPTMVHVKNMRIKGTAKPSASRIETTQLTSSQRQSPMELNSTQTVRGPKVDYLEKGKEAAVMSGGYYNLMIILNSVKMY